MATAHDRRIKQHRQMVRKYERERKMVSPQLGRTLLLLFVVAAVLVLSLMLFFKVRSIRVSGNSVYDTQSVCDASGIHLGDNLLAVNKSVVAGRIRSALPYVEQVHISRILPGTVELSLTETETPYRVTAEGGAAWLMNPDGKMIEAANGANEADPRLDGFAVKGPKSGEDAVSEDNPEGLYAAVAVMTALRGTGLAPEIRLIDTTKPYDIALQYADRFKIWLGGTDQLDYKFRYLQAVLEQLDSYQTGTIDLTFDEEKVARFIPS